MVGKVFQLFNFQLKYNVSNSIGKFLKLSLISVSDQVFKSKFTKKIFSKSILDKTFSWTQYTISRLTVQIWKISSKYQGCYCHEKAIKKLCCHVHEDISSSFLELWQIFKIICSHWRKIFVIYISPGLQNRKMLQFQFCMLQSMAYARFLAFCCNGWQLLVLGFFVDCWAHLLPFSS